MNFACFWVLCLSLFYHQEFHYLHTLFTLYCQNLPTCSLSRLSKGKKKIEWHFFFTWLSQIQLERSVLRLKVGRCFQGLIMTVAWPQVAQLFSNSPALWAHLSPNYFGVNSISVFVHLSISVEVWFSIRFIWKEVIGDWKILKMAAKRGKKEYVKEVWKDLLRNKICNRKSSLKKTKKINKQETKNKQTKTMKKEKKKTMKKEKRKKKNTRK